VRQSPPQAGPVSRMPKPRPCPDRKRRRPGRAVAVVLTLILLASLAPPTPASAHSAASAAQEPGLVTRLVDWLTSGLTGLFAGDPKGEMRPGTGKIALPGRDGTPVSASAKPQPPGKRVKELTGQRSAHARVFELADGRRQVELSADPVHYQAPDGSWRQIDTRVRAVAG
jgi:hypothetical protein